MQFTKTPTINTTDSQMKAFNNNNNSIYSNEKNWYSMNQQVVQQFNTPYILLKGVRDNNVLKLYNFFKNFGIIQDYVTRPQDSSMLIQYKSDESLKRALSYWESERKNFDMVILSIIQEEQKNQLYQRTNDYSTQNYQNNQMNYTNNQLPYYVDKKTSLQKFIDVLLNI